VHRIGSPGITAPGGPLIKNPIFRQIDQTRKTLVADTGGSEQGGHAAVRAVEYSEFVRQ